MKSVSNPERISGRLAISSSLGFSGFYITGFALIDLNSLITESIDEISAHYGKSE